MGDGRVHSDHDHISTHSTRNILPVKRMPGKTIISIANTMTRNHKAMTGIRYLTVPCTVSLYMAVAGATISDLSSPSDGGWTSESPLARTWLVADGSGGA